MLQFNYEVLRESEKAIFAKIPYYEATSDEVKKHKQLFFECWIPKTIIEKGVAKHFVIGKKNEKRLSNPYQKLYEMPHSWKTLGEYAPIKTAHIHEYIDYDKLKELVTFYENKYGAKLRTLLNDGEGSNGYVSDEDSKIILNLYFPDLNKDGVPKKQITIYK